MKIAPSFLLILGSCYSLSISRRDAISASFSTAAFITTAESTAAAAEISEKNKPKFQRYPQIRFIAALGDPSSSSGTGSDKWGLWRDDPGPRGVYLKNYRALMEQHNGVAPAGWTLDPNDWWLEEHGLIMSQPEPLPRKKFNKETKEILPYKRYVVTGDREVTTVLTVFEDGRWDLAKGSLYDVTHLPCRSARYTASDTNVCRPSNASQKDFPVKPGAAMPAVPSCAKQDYAVLFVLGEEL